MSQMSTSKISLLASKQEEIRQFNVDARKVQKTERSSYQQEIKARYEKLFAKDVRKIQGVPQKLCDLKLQNKFINYKKGMINRRIQNMVEMRTLHEWQLP